MCRLWPLLPVFKRFHRASAPRDLKRGTPPMVGWLSSAGMVSISTGEFIHNGNRLVYSDYGSGPRPFVLVPGLLLPRSLHDPPPGPPRRRRKPPVTHAPPPA